MILSGRCTSDRSSNPTDAFEAAERAVDRACRSLGRQAGDTRTLRAAVSSAARMTHSLATAVDRIARTASAAVADRAVATDVVADLKALRDHLVTGAVLIDPALEDLRELAGGLDVDEEFAVRFREWAAEALETETLES